MNLDTVLGDATTQKIAQLGHLVDATCVLSEAIRELGRVPAGILYAHVCGKMDRETFQQAIEMLRNAHLVSETAHVLCWIGPVLGAKL